MTPLEAMSQAIHFLDGLRESTSPDPSAEAELLLEHLARNGFVLRERKKHDRRGIGRAQLEVNRLSPAKIKAARERHALTLKELAHRSGIAVETLAGIESGEKRSYPRSVRAVLDALARLNAGLE